MISPFFFVKAGLLQVFHVPTATFFSHLAREIDSNQHGFSNHSHVTLLTLCLLENQVLSLLQRMSLWAEGTPPVFVPFILSSTLTSFPTACDALQPPSFTLGNTTICGGARFCQKAQHCFGQTERKKKITFFHSTLEVLQLHYSWFSA